MENEEWKMENGEWKMENLVFGFRIERLGWEMGDFGF
jgi:hypothetical protein